MYMNLVMLAGFLSEDAVVRCASNGRIFELVIDLINRGEESNEYALRSESDDLLLFGAFGEDAAIFKKGDYIIVTGELRQTKYENNSSEKSYTIWVKKLRWAPHGLIADLEQANIEKNSKEVMIQ
jgi:single-stranded DNA-binding protein